MFKSMAGAGAFAAALIATSGTGASAHCFVGARFFPATLGIDDPCVADELSIPTVTWSKSGDEPPVSERHFVPEEQPEALAKALLNFLGAHG